MRTILALSVGFLIGRMVYIRLDHTQALMRERRLKGKLQSLINALNAANKENNATQPQKMSMTT